MNQRLSIEYTRLIFFVGNNFISTMRKLRQNIESDRNEYIVNEFNKTWDMFSNYKKNKQQGL